MGDGGVRVRKRALFFSSHLPDLVRSYRSATSRPQRLRAGAVGGSLLGGKGLAQLVGMSAPSPVQRKDQGPSSSEVNLQPLTPGKSCLMRTSGLAGVGLSPLGQANSVTYGGALGTHGVGSSPGGAGD